MVHTEVVLQRNRSESLGSGFYFYVFFGLNSLVEPVAPAASLHYTACLFVNDFHFTVHHHIFIVLIEHRICFQQLLQRVYAFALNSIVIKQLVFLI